MAESGVVPHRDEAFAELVLPFREELHRHCYRMLGSLVDADDALQGTLVSAWGGWAGFEGRSSVRTWLFTIATNRCLNVLRSNSRRAAAELSAPFEVPPASGAFDLPTLSPYPEAAVTSWESIHLAFVSLLQRLPPRQAAALLIVDVLDFPLAEASAIIGCSPSATKGLLQRARARLREARQGDPTWPSPPARRDAQLAGRFADAYVRDDIDGLLGLLTDEAWLAMPPAAEVYRGKHAIGQFLEASSRARRGRKSSRLVPTCANGQPAFAWYFGHPGEERFVGILALGVRGGRIASIVRFHDAGLAVPFGQRPPLAT